MLKTQGKALQVTQDPSSAGQSKQQKAFNQSVRRIEKLREALAAWEAVMPGFRQAYAREVMPLQERAGELRRELLSSLTKAHERPGLDGTQRRTLRALIVELAAGLLAETDDPGLKEIYNHYSQGDFDQELAAEREETRQLLEQSLGIEIGDDVDVFSPEAILQHLGARAEARGAARTGPTAPPKRSARQRQREAQREADEARVRQSLRQVYQKLVLALHPDREPDPQERNRKTELMQRVNRAYAANNLLQLLELQIELEHIDQHHLDRLSDEQLVRYNTLLKSQALELETELQALEASFRLKFELSSMARIGPHDVMRALAVEVVQFQGMIRDLERDLQTIGSIATLRPWLRAMRRELRQSIGAARNAD
ncbi:MAG: J domain-containing protein [Pseudomonadota bacterium]|nr:J domain-containing protein [Pseudomonadota bacterium]